MLREQLESSRLVQPPRQLNTAPLGTALALHPRARLFVVVPVTPRLIASLITPRLAAPTLLLLTVVAPSPCAQDGAPSPLVALTLRTALLLLPLLLRFLILLMLRTGRLLDEVISGNQWHSVAISGTQRHSAALSSTHLLYEVISGNQWQSMVLSGTQ